MTIASLLLALITAAQTGAASTEPVLLDFHATWCGPCRQMRPAVEQLTRKRYPIKSIDIDQDRDLAEKYNVQAVPTFIVIDGSGRELDRTSGNQPAVQLARFYLKAKAKVQPPSGSNAHASEEGEGEGQSGEAESAEEDEPADTKAQPESEAPERAQPAAVNPKPWETVVRIRVLSKGSVGFGSGTVIHSTPNETLILTCAHIFKLDGQKQVPPERFPRRIMIDLFDGKLQGTKPAQVHFVESVEGQAIDYDFTSDVGLIRIRPGRRLPSARVVPAHWEPRSRMKMLTVGCSEGQDATAWYTMIVNPQMRGLAGNSTYQAIECLKAPKQGRSGGGLFTTDGYVAGVCNFAEPRGDHGLYATPRSIYHMLDRNELMALYSPVTRGSGTLLADRGTASGPRRQVGTPRTVARGQSPDQEDDVTIPPPELLGIRSPAVTLRTPRPEAADAAPTRRTAWHPTHEGPPSKDGPVEKVPRAEQTDLALDPSADHDRFSSVDPGDPTAKGKGDVNLEDLPPRAAAKAGGSPTGKSRWRPVRSGEGSPISGPNDR